MSYSAFPLATYLAFGTIVYRAFSYPFSQAVFVLHKFFTFGIILIFITEILL